MGEFTPPFVSTALGNADAIRPLGRVAVNIDDPKNPYFVLHNNSTPGGIVIGSPIQSGYVTADLSTYGGTLSERIIAARENGAKQFVIPVGDWPIQGADVLSGERMVGADREKTRILTTDGAGGFLIRSGTGSSVANMSLRIGATSYGAVFTLNSPGIYDPSVEDLTITFGPGVDGNAMNFVSAGLYGLKVQRNRVSGWQRMAMEFLNQGGDGRPAFIDTIVRDNIFENPTGAGNPTFAPAISVDGLIKNFLIENNVIRGSVGSAIEIIEATDVHILNTRTENCKETLLACSNVRTVYGLVVDGWNDVDPVGRTGFEIPTSDGAELRRIRSPSTFIYLGPAPRTKLIENDVSAGTLETGTPGLVFAGGGGGAGEGLTIQGGTYRIADCPANMALLHIQEKGKHSVQGARFERSETQTIFYFGAGTSDENLAKVGVVYQAGDAIRATPEPPVVETEPAAAA